VTSQDLQLDTVLGTMGGDSQPQVLLQLLARLLGAGQSAGTAMAAARWALASSSGGGFDTWADRGRVQVLLEDGVPSSWAADLADRGHDVQSAPAGGGFGHAQVIRVRGDVLEGASDPRAGTGAAAGY